MAKKKHEHGPLYQHAKNELELAGFGTPKGQNETSVVHTVLRLVDLLERGTGTTIQRTMALNLFSSLADGLVISDVTDNPDEWKPVPGLGENVMVNKRCNRFFSKDGGISWMRSDNGASGMSTHVEVKPKETPSDASKEKKDVQSDEGKPAAG